MADRQVCIVGRDLDLPTEGMDVVSRALGRHFREGGIRTSYCGPRLSPASLLALVRGRYDAIVFVHGPGPGVILSVALLRLLTPAKLVVVATRPAVNHPLIQPLRRAPGPHLLVTNDASSPVRGFARRASVIESFIGIDASRIRPRQSDRHFARSVPLLLHVGHLRKNRGLETLVEVKRRLGDSVHVLVQSSPNFPADPDVRAQLVAGGVAISDGAVSDLSGLYESADAYVFAVGKDGGAIELPLTVVEAIASGLPVITTDHGALGRALDGVPGTLVVPERDLVQAVCDFVEGRVELEPDQSGLPEHLDLDSVSQAIIRGLGWARV